MVAKSSSALPRLAYLDGWRGLSLLCVLGGHFLALHGLGPFGVELFFVLSGRLMAEILFEKQFPLGKFYWRRVSRIYPALLAFVVASYLVFQGAGGEHHIDLPAALRALTFTFNYSGHQTPMIDNIWSLCIEEHTYMLLGLVALLARRGKLAVLPTLWTLTALSMADGLASTLLLHQDWVHAYWRTDAHLGSITASAALYLQSRKWNPGRVGPWLSPCLAALAALTIFAPPWLCFSLGTLLAAGAIAMIDHSAPQLQRALSWKPLTFVGVTSYSIYLWQQPFFQFSFGQHRIGAIALCGGAVVLGYLSYRFVEGPARGWLNRLSERNAAAGSRPSAQPAA